MTYEYEDLSAFLDHELSNLDIEGVEELLSGNFGAQVHFRNLEAISKSTQQLQIPMASFEGFAMRVFESLGTVEMDGLDFEELSAYADQVEQTPEHAFGLDLEAAANDHLQNIQTLSKAMQGLKTPEPNEAFYTRLSEKLTVLAEPISFETLSAFHDAELVDTALETQIELNPLVQEQLSTLQLLSESIQQLPTHTASTDFESRLFQALESEVMTPDLDSLSAHYDGQLVLAPDALSTEAERTLDSFKRLSQGLQALEAFEPSENFLSGIEQKILGEEVLVGFEALSAHFDQEEVLDISALDELSQSQLGEFRKLSSAIEQLPEFQAGSEFLSNLEIRLSQESQTVNKTRVFAIPALMRQRYVRMVAGFALFGFLALATKNIIVSGDSQVLPAVVAVSIDGEEVMVPTTHIVQDVEFSAAEALFSEVDESLENFDENDYTELIGG